MILVFMAVQSLVTALLADSPAVKIGLYGLTIVADKNTQDPRLKEILPWLQKRFPDKGFAYNSSAVSALRKRNSTKISTPDGKTIVLTVEELAADSFTYRLEGYWTGKDGKPARWRGYRRTVRSKTDTCMANIPEVKVDDGMFVVVVKSELSE